MKIARSFPAAILSTCLFIISGCAGRGAYVPIDKQKLRGSGKIYFVPLGDFSPAKVEALVAYYRDKYGISAGTLPAVPLSPSAVDSERRQLVAEAVIELIKAANPDLVKDPKSILIGLTSEDMYISQYSWQFTFSWRQEERYAVVSDARMSISSRGTPAGAAMNRLRKMVTKNIGILYYRLPQSDDPRSVLYKNVGGIQELDYMGEEF
jgi:predicted Zn-dependent protease